MVLLSKTTRRMVFQASPFQGLFAVTCRRIWSSSSAGSWLSPVLLAAKNERPRTRRVAASLFSRSRTLFSFESSLISQSFELEKQNLEQTWFFSNALENSCSKPQINGIRVSNKNWKRLIKRFWRRNERVDWQMVSWYSVIESVSPSQTRQSIS